MGERARETKAVNSLWGFGKMRVLFNLRVLSSFQLIGSKSESFFIVFVYASVNHYYKVKIR